MNYGKPRLGRIAIALSASVMALVPLSTEVDHLLTLFLVAFLPTSWLLGVAFRIYDLKFIGLRRVNRFWWMSSRIWPLDFALRGYFRFRGDEPLLH